MATQWRHGLTLGKKVRVTDPTCIPVWAHPEIRNMVGYISELRATGYYPHVPPSYRVVFPNGVREEFFQDEIEEAK